MKTIVRIIDNCTSDNAYNDWKESVEQIVNGELIVHCEIANSDYNNVVEDVKNYQTDINDFKKQTTVIAKGYSQGDYINYTLYHNEKEDSKPLRWLVEELEKTFTHQHDYWVEKFERAEIDGKTFDAEPHDYTSFCIRHDEFPDREEVRESYIAIYGEDFDEIIVDIN